MLQRTLLQLSAAARIILAALALSGIPASAALPDTLGKWQASPALNIADAQLQEVAGQNAPLIREFGFVAASRRQYTNGADKLSITEWEMKDASGSLGLFTFLNTPGMTAEKYGESIATRGNGVTYVWNGTYLLEAHGTQLAESDMEILSNQIPPTDEQRGILPTLPSYFPSNDLLPMTRKYVLGPIGLERVMKRIPAAKLGMEPGTEAAVGQYQINGQPTTLLLLFYPTPQLASKKFAEFLELPELADGAGPPS